jgi:hypothetical protein
VLVGTGEQRTGSVSVREHTTIDKIMSTKAAGSLALSGLLLVGACK